MRDLSFSLRLHSAAPLARFKRTALPLRPFKNIISARYLSGDTFINDNAPCFNRFNISDFDYDEILCFLRLACPLPSLFESLDEKFEAHLIPRPYRERVRYRTPVWRIMLREKKQKLEFQTRPGCFKGSALEFFAYKRRKLKEKNWIALIEWAILLIYALLSLSEPIWIFGLFPLYFLKEVGCFHPVSSRIVRCFLRRPSYA